MKKKVKKKLVIVGIDGGTFDIINPLFKKNKLSNLKKIKNSGLLKSTMPPGTSVAWSSFATGNGPGKTNIYDFTIVNDDSWKIALLFTQVLSYRSVSESTDFNS